MFVPGHLLLPLSRDKGTPRQEIVFVPGQRDNGASRPVETLNKTDIQFDGKNNTLDCGGVLVLSKERNETIFFSNVSPSSQVRPLK